MPNNLKHHTGAEAFQQILLNTALKKLSAHAFQDTILSVLKEMLAFSQRVIRQLEESGQSPLVSCKKGCSYCCHSRVWVIPVEALLIHAFVQTHFTGKKLKNLQDRLDHTNRLTRGKTIEACFSARHDCPCVFLISEECSIYEVRPSICRSWNSFDMSMCRSAYHSNNPLAEIDVSQARNFVFGETRELFEMLSRQKLLQSEPLNLNTAVSNCLNAADPLGQWAAGKPVFTP